jgi:glycosyltransferase involved in cell wall biosynthesis
MVSILKIQLCLREVETMRILVVHESYQQRGGEDAVAAAEVALLESRGHNVLRYFRHNNELKQKGPLQILTAGAGTIWSRDSYYELDALLATDRPDVVHFHNTFPLISPAAYYACARHAIPVVQTLHNYRLVCPGATFLRKGHLCEECLGKPLAWRAVAHGCYRGSRSASAAVTAMLATHRLLQTWLTRVDAYIALSEFARNKHVAGGLPSQRIVVKPNFVDPDPGCRGPREKGSYALFVGRLSEEKGLRGLLDAWQRLPRPIPLFLLGDGPMRREVAAQMGTGGLSESALLGNLPHSEVFRWMQGARFLVCPSHWFEGCPLVIVEAFACGVPVIATGHGPTAEMVDHGRTGLHVLPGDEADLAAKVNWAWSNPNELHAMGQAARREFEARYTAQENYNQLISLYQNLVENKATMPQRFALAANSLRSGGIT